MSDEFEQARELLARAPRVLIVTGAGLSEESGVPPCYGTEGAEEGQDAAAVATPEAFACDPRRVWAWYGQWRAEVQRCQPNAAHRALARFVHHHRNALLATENVDDLHAQAACAAATQDDARPVAPVELLGNLFALRCTRCDARWEDRGPVDASSDQALPHCPRCQALARPDVVWFGEQIDRTAMARVLCQAELAAVCLVVGTTASVQPAASIAAVTAQAGGDVIEVNPGETELTPLCSIAIRAPAASVLPGLLDDDAGATSAPA